MLLGMMVLTMPKPKTRFNPFAYELGRESQFLRFRHKINGFILENLRMYLENDVKSYIGKRLKNLMISLSVTSFYLELLHH